MKKQIFMLAALLVSGLVHGADSSYPAVIPTTKDGVGSSGVSMGALKRAWGLSNDRRQNPFGDYSIVIDDREFCKMFPGSRMMIQDSGRIPATSDQPVDSSIAVGKGDYSSDVESDDESEEIYVVPTALQQMEMNAARSYRNAERMKRERDEKREHCTAQQAASESPERPSIFVITNENGDLELNMPSYDSRVTTSFNSSGALTVHPSASQVALRDLKEENKKRLKQLRIRIANIQANGSIPQDPAQIRSEIEEIKKDLERPWYDTGDLGVELAKQRRLNELQCALNDK